MAPPSRVPQSQRGARLRVLRLTLMGYPEEHKEHRRCMVVAVLETGLENT